MASVLATITAAGIPVERAVLLGFSQGACLALAFAARHPERYGGIIGLSGALTQKGDEMRHFTGDLTGAPVFLGYSTTDPRVPSERVERSARIFRELGSDVTLHLYSNVGHVVIPDEVQVISAMIAAAMKGGGA